MPDPSDLNPFSAPQSGSLQPVRDQESHPEEEILLLAELELSKTKYGIRAVGFVSLALAVFATWQMLFVLTQFGDMPTIIGNALGLALYTTAGCLALLIAGKIKAFTRNPKPVMLDEVFRAQATFWKFLGVAAIVSLAIVIPLVFLSVLLIV